MSTETTKDKVVLSAIECLEKYGRAGVTIRKIASMAGVNSAAISYYFGGLENLMEIVMRQTLNNAFDPSQYVAAEKLCANDYLKTVFTDLTVGARVWPNISKAHFYSIYTDGDYGSLVTSEVNKFLERVFLVLKDKLEMPDDEIKRRVCVLMSQVVYMVISPMLLQDFFNETVTERFINNLIDDLFAAH